MDLRDDRIFYEDDERLDVSLDLDRYAFTYVKIPKKGALVCVPWMDFIEILDNWHTLEQQNDEQGTVPPGDVYEYCLYILMNRGGMKNPWDNTCLLVNRIQEKGEWVDFEKIRRIYPLTGPESDDALIKRVLRDKSVIAVFPDSEIVLYKTGLEEDEEE